ATMSRLMRGTIARAFVCAAALLLRLAPARADGAFSDSLAIFVPVNKPHEIVLATNFGLIIAQDDGATWYGVCEQAVASQARLYQMGPPPGNRLLAVSPLALVTSTDGACTWQVAGGALDGAIVSNAFPDPNDAMHVLALGVPGNDANMYVPP